MKNEINRLLKRELPYMSEEKRDKLVDAVDSTYSLQHSHARAWRAVCAALKLAQPRWASRKGSGLDCAMHTVVELSDRAAALRNGNTSLLRALMELVTQNLPETSDGALVVRPDTVSAIGDALGVLVDAGFATAEGDLTHRLNWSALEAREKHPASKVDLTELERLKASYGGGAEA